MNEGRGYSFSFLSLFLIRRISKQLYIGRAKKSLLLCGWSCLHLSCELYLRASALFSNHSPGQQKDLHADGAEQRRQKTLDE